MSRSCGECYYCNASLVANKTKYILWHREKKAIIISCSSKMCFNKMVYDTNIIVHDSSDCSYCGANFNRKSFIKIFRGTSRDYILCYKCSNMVKRNAMDLDYDSLLPLLKLRREGVK